MNSLEPFDPKLHPLMGAKARFRRSNDFVYDGCDDFSSFADYRQFVRDAASTYDGDAEQCKSVLIEFNRLFIRKSETERMSTIIKPLAKNFPNAERITINFNYITALGREITTVLDLAALPSSVKVFGFIGQQQRISKVSFAKTSVERAMIDVEAINDSIAIIASPKFEWIVQQQHLYSISHPIESNLTIPGFEAVQTVLSFHDRTTLYRPIVI